MSNTIYRTHLVNSPGSASRTFRLVSAVTNSRFLVVLRTYRLEWICMVWAVSWQSGSVWFTCLIRRNSSRPAPYSRVQSANGISTWKGCLNFQRKAEWAPLGRGMQKKSSGEAGPSWRAPGSCGAVSMSDLRASDASFKAVQVVWPDPVKQQENARLT